MHTVLNRNSRRIKVCSAPKAHERLGTSHIMLTCEVQILTRLYQTRKRALKREKLSAGDIMGTGGW